VSNDAVTYKLEQRGKTATAVIRVAPNGSERVLVTYRNPESAANVRLALAMAAGAEVANR
jgi:hypothetical protein